VGRAPPVPARQPGEPGTLLRPAATFAVPPLAPPPTPITSLPSPICSPRPPLITYRRTRARARSAISTTPAVPQRHSSRIAAKAPANFADMTTQAVLSEAQAACHQEEHPFSQQPTFREQCFAQAGVRGQVRVLGRRRRRPRSPNDRRTSTPPLWRLVLSPQRSLGSST